MALMALEGREVPDGTLRVSTEATDVVSTAHVAPLATQSTMVGTGQLLLFITALLGGANLFFILSSTLS
jgi:hypothetical protein